jgi:hypothetical protein
MQKRPVRTLEWQLCFKAVRKQLQLGFQEM